MTHLYEVFLMVCREKCGACCIAPSIEQPYFGMPSGKPAGVICKHLDPNTYRCAIWGTEHYPKTCLNFQAEPSICGNTRDEAIKIISLIETETRPK